jgi:voltage-gated potassium channel
VTRIERWEARTALPLIGLGIVFLVAYALPIIDPALSEVWRITCGIIEIIVWVAFAIDFIVRLVLAPKRWRFLATHPVDALAVVLPVLRPLRALSIVFLSVRQLSKVLRNRVMVYIVSTAIAVWLIAGLAVTEAERNAPGSNIHDVWTGWWWAFITMATVGYGDVFPVTVEGRLVALALVVTGVTLIGTMTAYIASWFAAATRASELAIKAEIDTALDTEDDRIDALARELRELREAIERRSPPPA